MTKKSKKTKKTESKESLPSFTTIETRGFLILASALILFLSLTSFAAQSQAQNALGLLGHSLGWLFHATFGISSYLWVLYLSWIGWRYLLGKTIPHLWLKNAYVTIAILSSSMLLSILESDAPQVSQSIEALFYPSLYKNHSHFHLGGAPFFLIYHDLPGISVHHIFNTVGASLIFSTALIASLFFLFKIQPIALVKAFSQRLREELDKKNELLALADAIPAIERPAKKPFNANPENEESDFLRFVKLRIPTSAIQENSKAFSSTNLPSSDLLAIQPEKNLKERPSVSRKEQFDDEEELLKPRLETLPPVKPKRKESVAETITEVKEPSPAKKREAALIAQSIHNGDFSQFQLPSSNLLHTPKIVDQSSLKKDLKRKAEVLEETLLSFGIEAKVGQINCGPTITSFEVHPAIGVKVQKIKTLDNDIALNMEAKSIRIIAPIPGKAAVGIEVPNSHPQEVAFKDMLTAYQQSGQKFHIPILLGKAVNGDYVMSDLAKMPHCIIAGATGSGKSVCINTIVMSILLNARPDQIKLLMVDPKKVELTPYTKLPHMLAPVITEPQGAAAALNWLVKEMESRYEILKLCGVRNIDSFNKRTINKELEEQLGREIPAELPYIVGIIDELADLMMVASQDIETPIARIAQMARAVGIHLILATQRPSREVITGLIKANFPTRIAFKVASRVNSQIILDETGAESLLGNGDMLFLPPGSSHLLRAQGAFIRDEDILSVVKHICDQAPPNYLIQSFDKIVDFSIEGGREEDTPELDSLYQQALEVVLSTGNASTTFLQRKLKVGYARAASLMDQMEKNGIVGPIEGAKPRKIYAKRGGGEEETGEADF